MNLPLAKKYYSVLKELKDKLHLKEEVSLHLLVEMRDVIIIKEQKEVNSGKEEEEALNGALNDALDSLERMRLTEGEILYKDFLEKVDCVRKLIDKISMRSPLVLMSYRDRLSKRVKELSGVFEVDAQRLNQEIAFLAERSDITEELVRFKSHIEQFGKMINIDEPVGRGLDFLLQEMNREINTVASKANDAEISYSVVSIKGELEKIREQVQNIE